MKVVHQKVSTIAADTFFWGCGQIKWGYGQKKKVVHQNLSTYSGCSYFSVLKRTTTTILQAFQKDSPLASDVSREILEVKENGKMHEISDKWFGQVNCGCRNGTTVAGKRLDLDHFKGLFLISGLSSLSALIISLFIFIYKNRSVLTARGPIKQKLSDLAGAFDREREDKSSKDSRTSFEERVVEEGKISQDVC